MSMFAPEMPPVDLPEFFGKMSEFRKAVSEVDISSLPSEKAELFRSLLKEFDSSAATLKEEVPGILDDLRSKYKEAVASAENEHASNMAAIEKARQRHADAPARWPRPPPRPRRSGKRPIWRPRPRCLPANPKPCHSPRATN
jgi:hypothetical protein